MEGPAALAVRAINASPAVPQFLAIDGRSPRPQAVNGRSCRAFIAVDGRSRQLPQSAPGMPRTRLQTTNHRRARSRPATAAYRHRRPRCVCVFEQQTSDVTVNSENEETRRGFTSAVMLPNDQGLLCVTADQQFLFYCPKRTDDGDFELSLYRRLIGYNDEILVLKFIGEEEQYIAVATNLEQFLLANALETYQTVIGIFRIGEESRLRVRAIVNSLRNRRWLKKAEDYRNSLQQEAQAKSQALHFEDELARKRMPVTARDMHSRYIPQQDYFSEGLYTFDIGQNDLAGEFYSRTEDQVIVSIPTILLEFENGLKKLYDQGARKFWIHNTGPLGCLPQNIALFGKDPSQLDELHCVAKHNRAAKLFNL
ncbi:GDSL esterase/lipase [Zea mays]|uniref:GDSL esterase/lipase n=1 Tax=Zea mays TaxID=4577 RepID=A0A3L6FEL3_MAIZE|nr:GDSL esterase/lipase [Zea mays]